VIVYVGAVAGQSEKDASVIGVEAIKSLLTSHRQWILYWDHRHLARPGIAGTTSDRSRSVTLEFMRTGRRFIAHWENDSHFYVECEFDVAVREDAISFSGCVGPDKTMKYDPEDGEYPFKGRMNGVLLWLAPSK
jgi:hypothetical protein